MQIRGKPLGETRSVTIGVHHGMIGQVGQGQGEDLGDDDLVIAPGFIDLQVNGVGGLNVNGNKVTPEIIAKIPGKLYPSGTTRFCPTIITGPQEQMIRSLTAIREACRDSKVDGAIPGIHVEGPYISSEDGPRGAHMLQYVRDPDWDEFRRWQETSGGKIRILTLAPERSGAIRFIEKVVESGVIVSLGHTAAEPTHIDAAIKAGARMSTHLGNGSHSMLPRHSNYIWEQLSRDELWMGFMADGHHLPPSVVKCLVRAKGLNRSILVSDAVALAGMPPGRYDGEAISGVEDPREVDLSPEGKISLAGTPYLAGAGLLIDSGVQNAVGFCDIPLSQAVRMASYNPARALGIEGKTGSLDSGKSADMVLLRWDDELKRMKIEATIFQGEMVYEAKE